MTLLNINNIDLDNERFIRSTKHAVVNIVLEQGNLKVYETRLESLKHSRLNAFSFSTPSKSSPFLSFINRELSYGDIHKSREHTS